MKKNTLLVALSSLLLLSACGPESPVSAPASSPSSSAKSSALKEFEGLTFENQSVVYDGQKHSLVVNNVPADATIAYSGQDYVNAGSYAIAATINKTGYVEKKMTATLTITEADLTPEKVAALGLSFADASFPYDAESHSVQLVGDVPAGTTVSYKIGDVEGNSATEVGEYTVICTLKMRNYHSYSLTAKLSIVAVEKTLYSTVLASTILFQNDLDNDALYRYETQGGTLAKVSNDVMGGFSTEGGVSFGIVKSLWGKAVVSYQKDTNGNLVKEKVFSGTAVDCLASVDSGHFFYSVHNVLLNKEDNGIYFYTLSDRDDDYRGVKVISDDYASKMLYADGVLYFVNGDKNVVSYTASTGVKTTYLVDGNIYDLTYDSGYLYYNKGSVAAKGLYRLNLSSKKESKLTLDNGINLTIVGNYLYYLNKDLLTDSLFGKGIYKVPLDGTLFDASGTLVISGKDDKIGSLSSDGTSLFYYRFNTAHFFKNDVAGATEVDLMADFVKPEDTTLVGGAANAYANGQVYFANLKDDGCLYKYDLNSRMTFKVLPFSVNNVYVNGNYLYFGSYVGTNYAEWRMDLTSKVISKISKDRCESLRFVGETIYYLNVGTTKATLHSMNLDGTNDTEILSDGLDPFSLSIQGNTAYVVRDPAIGNKVLASVNLTSKTLTKTSAKCLYFVEGETGKLYLDNEADKTLVQYDVGAASTTTLISAMAKISDLAFVNGKLYAQDVSASALVNYQSGAWAKLAEISPSGMVGDGTNLYFVSAQTSYVNNYPASTYVKTTSNGNLYSYSSELKTLYTA